MTDIATALQHITPDGIVGIVLIFGAISILLSASTWLITKYTKSKNDLVNHENKISKSKITNEELPTK